MTKNQSSLFCYLCRWACGSICMVAIVAVVFQLRPNWHESLPFVNPISKPADRQNPSPAELIAALDERLQQERDRVAQIQESLSQARSLRDSLRVQVQSSEQAIAERRNEIVRYADLVNADEGLILASGEIVSASALRGRAITRRNELAAVTEQLSRKKAFVTRVRSTVAELEQLLSRRQQDIAELTALRIGLAEKVNLLSRIEAGTSTRSSGSMVDLRESVHRMQDVIEVRLELLEEAEIEQALSLADRQSRDSTVGSDSRARCDRRLKVTTLRNLYAEKIR